MAINQQYSQPKLWIMIQSNQIIDCHKSIYLLLVNQWAISPTWLPSWETWNEILITHDHIQTAIGYHYCMVEQLRKKIPFFFLFFIKWKREGKTQRQGREEERKRGREKERKREKQLNQVKYRVWIIYIEMWHMNEYFTVTYANSMSLHVLRVKIYLSIDR